MPEAGFPQPPGRPDHTLVSLKPAGIHRGVDRVVLHRVDFTQSAAEHPRCRSRRDKQCRQPPARCRRGGDHQDAVQAHGALNRRVRPRLDQIGAGTQVCPNGQQSRRSRSALRVANDCTRCTLRRGRPNPVCGAVPGVLPAIGQVTGWALEWSGASVVVTRRCAPVDRAQAAAELTHDRDRRGDAAAGERQIVREIDRAVRPSPSSAR